MATPQSPGYGLGLRLIEVDGRSLTGHTGSMPGFLASLFVDRESRRGSILMTNAFSGLSMEAGARASCSGDDEPGPHRAVAAQHLRCPTRSVACRACGSGATPPWSCAGTTACYACTCPGMSRTRTSSRYVSDRIVGTAGYHRGETLHVHRREDGSVSHLVCATFVYTRIPYDPDVPIPGGHPA